MAYSDNDADDKMSTAHGDPSTSTVRLKPKGVVRQMAAKAGMSVAAWAKANIHADGEVGKLARLAYTMQGVHGDGESTMAHGGDKRKLSQKLYQVG